MFRFECKYGNLEHQPWDRGRKKSGNGTTHLKRKAEACDKQRLGLVAHNHGTEEPTPNIQLYSEAYHRAILATWSAASHRSFESLVDHFHQMEVSYLRPGTSLPSSITISRDVKAIHAKYAPRIKDYFQV